MMNKTLHLTLFSFLLTAACGGADERPSNGSTTQSLVGLTTFVDLLNDRSHHRLAYLLEETGLAQDLESGPGPYTLLAPNQTQLDLLIDGTPELREERWAYVRAFLEQHVVHGDFGPQDLASATRTTSRFGVDLEPGPTGDLVNPVGSRARATGSGWAVLNGSVVVVDMPLPPLFSVEDDLIEGGYGLFVEATVAAQVDGLRDWTTEATVFAPVDEAFLVAGLDMAGLHQPGNRDQVEAIVAQHVAEFSDPSSYFEQDLLAENGSVLRVELAYDSDGRERSGVHRYGALVAFVSDDHAEAFTERGTLVPLDRVIVPKP